MSPGYKSDRQPVVLGEQRWDSELRILLVGTRVSNCGFVTLAAEGRVSSRITRRARQSCRPFDPDSEVMAAWALEALDLALVTDVYDSQRK